MTKSEIKPAIRYSEAFKIQIVRELESGTIKMDQIGRQELRILNSVSLNPTSLPVTVSTISETTSAIILETALSGRDAGFGARAPTAGSPQVS
jgi:hypothetical protein